MCSYLHKEMFITVISEVYQGSYVVPFTQLYTHTDCKKSTFFLVDIEILSLKTQVAWECQI